MFKKFIERPVLSTVISIIIVILGILGLITLPVSQYPEIAPPTVQVSASYQGANADVVMSSVVVPLEEQINGVEDMTYMTSSAGNDGTATITVNFKLGTNPDLAAVNVQNRVARATSLLPAEVTRAGVITAKKQASNVLIFAIYSDSASYDQKFLQNYANINLIPQIKRINGVGDATAFGLMDYSMRIWLKPEVMATYGLVPNDISVVLAEQNIEAAPGQFGEQGDQSFQYTLKYSGRLKNETEFSNIIVRTAQNGQVLRLKDIARIELGAQSYSSSVKFNGKPALGIAINQTAGSNAKEVIEGAIKVLDESSVNFPKGVHYTALINVNDFLDASIEKVIHTLIEAFILVFLVVFIFLQDFRSTLIPAISVPVAIIGTFFFLSLFGFTINLLTLFALVLAIGIVVDDAIVVVEAVHAKLDHGYTSAKKATIDAMEDITGAIISITLVMAAVFIPVSFIQGSSGVFYKQFGLTLAIAIILSAINALTLSPALCALFLKPHAEDHNKPKNFMQRFYTAFNASFDAMTNRYKRSVSFLARRKWIAGLGIVLFTIVLIWTMSTTPKGFVPNEDLGTVMSDISLPPATSQEQTALVIKKIDSIAHTIPEIKFSLTVVGRSMISGTGSSYGMVIGKLKPWDERQRDVKAIIAELFAKTASIKGARIIFFAPPTIQGFGTGGGFEFQLQDKTGGDINKFSNIANGFLAALAKRPEIQYASTSFNPNFPQYQIDVNVATVKQAGLSVSDVLAVLQGYYGGVYASNFNKFGKQYRVMYQADAQYRANEQTLNNIYVRNSGGQMAPISNFITLKKVYGPQAISRFNLFTSIAVTGNPNAGYSSGDALKAVQEEAAIHLPTGYGYEFSGLSREEMSSGSQTIFIFLLCVIFVYFLLCAQYESYILPLAVLISLPIGLAGVFIFDKIFKVDNNIYTQITLIMLVGLLAKNAILIVEFAVDRRRKGMSIVGAAISGATARLRPILMTSFAFILGLLPLMLSTGVGAAGNKSIGTGAVGGMLIGTLFGVFVIPALFIVFQSIQEKVSSKSPFDEGYGPRQEVIEFPEVDTREH
ncbi:MULTISPECIES: efflux RND transporter permease subunit [Pedobacter]|uniref:Transporter, hydrophobe/amphiphile efflux-1 (HAE1) family n=1 Tax=Pedobacter heparinus (strain ATCC 13125 / DSM 2366 / CIP 104194 / JCM 7457 / NBRC 12017 / NCIMB 9290 / NRRL B-14731 / HIM 762-3) TaxID=485917 RepID=C6XS60_PEDHD|nr:MULTISPECIES: efflux RND transporter permease subunit [Pedobacter]ACU03405.1 transporter, hydrophobe/amphiphile efflux-1 (HAE1) family [Pedobacter heparinus DSM 2366]MBB5439118.1 HAE1 family hydrophobic/amphiphilic exporter-1 [Pedobacter sp. AK017]